MSALRELWLRVSSLPFAKTSIEVEHANKRPEDKRGQPQSRSNNKISKVKYVDPASVRIFPLCWRPLDVYNFVGSTDLPAVEPMPPEQFSLADYHANDGGGMGIFGQAIGQLPSAARELASEAWEHPGQALGHAAKVVVESAVMGTAIGYLVPARGPASILIGAALLAPAAYHAGNRLSEAHEQAKDPMADQQAIAHALARDSITGTTDLGLSFAGGFAGAEVGYALAGSRGTVGRFAQKAQRGILNVENKSMAWFKARLDGRTSGGVGGAMPKIDIYNTVPKSPGSNSAELVNANITPAPIKPAIQPERLPFGQRTLGILNRRVEQYLELPHGEYNMYMGSLHGHSRYSDGMGTPKELYAKAKEQGYDFTAITDHNHIAARGGVKPGDARAKDQSGTPVLAEKPILYSQTFADAHAVTENGKFVGLVGIELGTIGKVGGHKHNDFMGPELPAGTAGVRELPGVKPIEPTPPRQAGPEPKRIDIEGKPTRPAQEAAAERIIPTTGEPVGPVGKLPDVAPEPVPRLGRDGHDHGSMSIQEMQIEAVSARHLGGVNHINLFEVPTFLETVRQPRGILDSFIQRMTGRDPAPVVKKPDVIKINDGDFRALVNHLDLLKDTTGGTPVIQLNHPRFRADENPNLPRGERARDYGQKSFRSRQEWLDRFADPYVRQIEVIKGGALRPDPVDVVAPGHIDATSFAGYIDKGVHASPTFGRDFHYGDPGGNPGATGILAKSLDKPSLINALRERRTIATTNGEKLNASMWGNEKHPMGSILDQAVVPELTLSARIGGEVVPAAQYKVKLLGDSKVGDKKLAQVVQEISLTGEQLLAMQNRVSFDPVEHRLGRKSAYYMEIHRTDPITGHTDRMWTAPIWVEPLTGAKHSFYMRWLTGNSANFLDSVIRGR